VSPGVTPDADASPSRIAAAATLRRLGHAFVGHHVPDDVLDRLRAGQVEGRVVVTM